MRTLGIIVVTTAALAVALINAMPGGASNSQAGITSAQAIGIADAESSVAGDSRPTDTTVMHGTLREVMLRINPENNNVADTPETAVPVTLVMMRGSFLLRQARVPSGQPLPQGNLLAVVIETSTGDVVGRALPAEVPTIAGAARANDGVLIGRVLFAGGPRRAARPHYADRLRVIVRHSAHIVRSLRTNRHGSFALHVAPGRYQVVGQLRSGRFCPAQKVTVRRGDRRFVDLKCSIR